MSTISMSVSDWIKVRDNPVQRDTERHAAKAKHLLTPSPTHAIVFAARLLDQTLVKLDGHTRALLWRRNLVKHPPKVIVNVIDVADMNEAITLYKQFDAKEALESAADKVTGGYRFADFVPHSPLLRGANITYALRIAWRGWTGDNMDVTNALDPYVAVKEFGPELAFIDGMMLRAQDVTTAILAAVILTYRKHGESVAPFWRQYFSDGGTRANGRMDGVQALRELALLRMKRRMYGGSAAYDLCARSLNAVEKWLRNEDFRETPRPIELAGYAFNQKAKSRLVRAAA